MQDVGYSEPQFSNVMQESKRTSCIRVVLWKVPNLYGWTAAPYHLFAVIVPHLDSPNAGRLLSRRPEQPPNPYDASNDLRNHA